MATTAGETPPTSTAALASLVSTSHTNTTASRVSAANLMDQLLGAIQKTINQTLDERLQREQTASTAAEGEYTHTTNTGKWLNFPLEKFSAEVSRTSWSNLKKHFHRFCTLNHISEEHRLPLIRHNILKT